MKKEPKKKTKKVITMDFLILISFMFLSLLVLVGFVTYNFGHSDGAAEKAQKIEDATNQEIFDMTKRQQELVEKYKDVYELVVDPSEAHESEELYDLSTYKKDYPLVNYSVLYQYGQISSWQVIIRNKDGSSRICLDTDMLYRNSDQMYTYITPYVSEEESANVISVLVDGEEQLILPCERIYFTSEELKNAFQAASELAQ